MTWRKLPADDPLTDAAIVTPWSHGYLAVARDVGSFDAPRSHAWTSPDGVDWTDVSNAFPEGSLVVSAAPTRDGVVAITLQVRMPTCEPGDVDEPVLGCFLLAEPLVAWTSADGLAWTSHPIDGLPIPEDLFGQDGSYPVLESDLRGLALLRMEDEWLGRSTDGVDWSTFNSARLPPGWRADQAVAFRDGYIAVGRSDRRALALRSTDGRAWTRSALPPGCNEPTDYSTAGNALVAGSAGMIVVSSFQQEDGTSPYRFCSSVDGRGWTTLSGFKPVGPSTANDECRDICPAGVLIGDGDRLVAFRMRRGVLRLWRSLDGVTWSPTTQAGDQPVRGPSDLRMQLLPGGLLASNSSGAAWLGTASP